MNQLAETIARWLIYRISFHGFGFKFASTYLETVIRLSVCNLVSSIFHCAIGLRITRFWLAADNVAR